MRAVFRAISFIVAMGAGAALTFTLASRYWLGSYRALPGTWLGGHAYDPDLHTSPAAWLELRRSQLLERRIYLRLSDETFEFSFGELGLELDVPDVLEAMEREAQEGPEWARLLRAVRARRGLIEQPVLFKIDEKRARDTLKGLAPLIRSSAVNARLDLNAHRRVESRAGRELDIEGTLKALEHASLQSTPVISARELEIQPEVTTEMLSDIDVSKVLSSYETSFEHKAGSRAINIRRAAEYLDETILAPHAELSFNKVVGPREESRGFAYAPVIVNDELDRDVGGGVCQVATTLHAAAVFGLLEVTRRRSHSRPSGYAPLGLDATVIYGKVDLRLKNPYDTPLMIHAYLPSRYTIRVELLGREPAAKVTHSYAVTEKYDFVRRVATKPFLEAGEYERRQKGIPGYDVISVLNIEYEDGTKERRSYRSKYYPVPEVYWLKEGAPLSELPALPEGATHTEQVGDADAAGSEATVDEGTLRG